MNEGEGAGGELVKCGGAAANVYISSLCITKARARLLNHFTMFSFCRKALVLYINHEEFINYNEIHQNLKEQSNRSN